MFLRVWLLLLTILVISPFFLQFFFVIRLFLVVLRYHRLCFRVVEVIVEHSQIALERVRQTFLHILYQIIQQVKVHFFLLSLGLAFLLTVSVKLWLVFVAVEDLEKWFLLYLFINDSLLSCFLVLLSSFDILNGGIVFPVYHCADRLVNIGPSVRHTAGEFFISEEFVFIEFED